MGAGDGDDSGRSERGLARLDAQLSDISRMIVGPFSAVSTLGSAQVACGLGLAEHFLPLLTLVDAVVHFDGAVHHAGDGGRAGTSSDGRGPPCSWTLPSGSVVDISSWSAQGCGASTSLHSFDCARHLSADLVAWICWSFQFAHSGPRDSIGEWLNSLVPLSLLTRVDNCPRPDTLCFLSL